ncbi:MAG: YbaK/EbsC family protein [Hyphomicrobiaceae bacterium]|nr:YbaK/EbsC family protein [Hyphomicrobiaceae bacterium]
MTDTAQPIRAAACERVARALKDAGLEDTIREMPASTRTAEDAASACGCAVGQIVKSLVFRGKHSGRALLFLVAGDNRLDMKAAEALAGEPVSRPDAAYVRAETGFAIGGIPPLGHDRALKTYMDEDLLDYPLVHAAAGTPNSVFSVAPDALKTATSALSGPLKEAAA